MDHPPFEGNVGRTPKRITESEHSRAQGFNPAQRCQVPALHGNSMSNVGEKQANPGKILHAKKYHSFSSSVKKKQQDLPQSTAGKSEQRVRRGVTQGWGEWPRCEQPNKHRHKVVALTEGCLSRGKDNPNSYSGIQNNFSHNLSLEKSFILNNLNACQG